MRQKLVALFIRRGAPVPDRHEWRVAPGSSRTAGQQGGNGKRRGHGGEYNRIICGIAEQQRSHQPRAGESHDEPATESHEGRPHALPQDHGHDPGRWRTQGQADAQLPLPLTDRVGHDAVDAQARENQGDAGERGDQREHHFASGDGSFDLNCDRATLDRLFRIDFLNGLGDEGLQVGSGQRAADQDGRRPWIVHVRAIDGRAGFVRETAETDVGDDSDDFPIRAAEHHTAADGVFARREKHVNERVIHYYYTGSGQRVILLGEVAPPQQRNPEHTKVVTGHVVHARHDVEAAVRLLGQAYGAAPSYAPERHRRGRGDGVDAGNLAQAPDDLLFKTNQLIVLGEASAR